MQSSPDNPLNYQRKNQQRSTESRNNQLGFKCHINVVILTLFPANLTKRSQQSDNSLQPATSESVQPGDRSSPRRRNLLL